MDLDNNIIGIGATIATVLSSAVGYLWRWNSKQQEVIEELKNNIGMTEGVLSAVGQCPKRDCPMRELAEGVSRAVAPQSRRPRSASS